MLSNCLSKLSWLILGCADKNYFRNKKAVCHCYIYIYIFSYIIAETTPSEDSETTNGNSQSNHRNNGLPV